MSNTTTTTPSYLDLNTMAAWLTEFNKNATHTWEKFINFAYNKDDNQHVLFADETSTEFDDESIIKVFTDTWRELNSGYHTDSRWNSLKSLRNSFYENLHDTFNDIIENNLIQEYFNNIEYLFENETDKWRKIYAAHEDSIDDDFDTFLDNVKGWINDNGYYEVNDNSFKYVEDITIPMFLALAGSEHFNREAGDDGYSTLTYAADKALTRSDNPTATFLDKCGYSYKDLVDMTITYYRSVDTWDETKRDTINDIYQGIANANDNITLGFPLAMTIGDIFDLTDGLQPTLTLINPTVGYHGYVYGNGSVGICNITVSKTLVYEPNEWMLVPENTYGYSLESVYGFDDPDDYKSNDSDNIVFEAPIFSIEDMSNADMKTMNSRLRVETGRIDVKSLN